MSVEDNELETLRAALKKANAEAKQYREEKELLATKVEELSSDDTLTKMQQRIIKTEAKSRLVAEGVKDPDRILKYVTADNVKVTDDGLEGLDEVLGGVKKDLPELFDKKRQVAGGADAGVTGKTPELSATEKQVARIFNH
jgi:hypothetical protein